MRLPVRSLASVRRRLGRWTIAGIDALRSLPYVGHRLGRWQLAGVLALGLAAMALGVGAGASDPDAKRTERAQAPPAARPVVVSSAERRLVAQRLGRKARRVREAQYRRTARKKVPAEVGAGFVPLYREAERVFGVNWLLLASVHHQETAFSTAPSTYHGLNDFGCCAGPMQFNVTNGPVSTWERYRNAYRKGRRPKRYPHPTRRHPSIYDDFDAIMAAGSLLKDSGAWKLLDAGAWWASYSYYGHDLYGVTYASTVLARAVGWERNGFCPDCALDEGLVAEFDALHGDPVRRQLIADDQRKAKRKRRKKGADRKADRREERKRRRSRGDRRRRPSAERRVPRSPAKPRPRRRRRVPAESLPEPTTTTQPTTPTPPPPPAEECPPIRKLLRGCR